MKPSKHKDKIHEIVDHLKNGDPWFTPDSDPRYEFVLKEGLVFCDGCHALFFYNLAEGYKQVETFTEPCDCGECHDLRNSLNEVCDKLAFLRTLPN